MPMTLEQYLDSYPSQAEEDAAAERANALETSELASDLLALLAKAQATMELFTRNGEVSFSRMTNEHIQLYNLAEKLIDMHGPADDCHTIRNILEG